MMLQLLPQHTGRKNSLQLGKQDGLWQSSDSKFGGPKKGLGNWALGAQADKNAGTWWELLKERTGRVLGNWTQKEGQLSSWN